MDSSLEKYDEESSENGNEVQNISYPAKFEVATAYRLEGTACTVKIELFFCHKVCYNDKVKIIDTHDQTYHSGMMLLNSVNHHTRMMFTKYFQPPIYNPPRP